MELVELWWRGRQATGVALDVLLLAVIVVSAVTDFRQGKVYNKVTLPAMLGALVLHGTRGGLEGVGLSLLGGVIAFALFVVLGMVGAMGGGDVKLMGAMGAIFAYPLALWGAFWAVMGAGVCALVVMTVRGELIRTFRRIGWTIYTFVTPGMVTEPPSREDSTKLPFAVGAGVGCATTWLLAWLGRLPALR